MRENVKFKSTAVERIEIKILERTGERIISQRAVEARLIRVRKLWRVWRNTKGNQKKGVCQERVQWIWCYIGATKNETSPRATPPFWLLFDLTKLGTKVDQPKKWLLQQKTWWHALQRRVMTPDLIACFTVQSTIQYSTTLQLHLAPSTSANIFFSLFLMLHTLGTRQWPGATRGRRRRLL